MPTDSRSDIAPPLSLGTHLLALRRAHQWSLRQAVRGADISNGYLSQLEHDKIRSPSPAVLVMLADRYRTSYAQLLVLAGYIDRDAELEPRVLIHGLERLNASDLEEVQEIIAMKLRRAERRGAAAPALPRPGTRPAQPG